MSQNNLDVQLSAPQYKILTDPTRFKVVVCGRRFGKTYVALWWLIIQALQSNDGDKHYYIAPTLAQAKEIAWTLLKQFAEPFHVKVNESETLVQIETLNGGIASIRLRGAKESDGKRGVSLSSVVMDEFAFYESGSIWESVIRPAISDKQAPVLFITSPNGWNWAKKDIYDKAVAALDDEWKSWTYTTLDGGRVPKKEIESARRSLTPKMFAQEYEASFETLSSRVYSYFDRKTHVTPALAKIDDTPELHIGIDFNIGNMSACVGIKVSDQLHLVDEFALGDESNTLELAEAIRQRYPHHRITVYPDPAGRARKTSASAGVTDFTILESARYNFNVIAPKRHPLVQDRVNEVQLMLKNAAGDVRMYVHPRCEKLIESLDGLTYKNGEPDKKSGLDHFSDCTGYLVNGLFPLDSNAGFIPLGRVF